MFAAQPGAAAPYNVGFMQLLHPDPARLGCCSPIAAAAPRLRPLQLLGPRGSAPITSTSAAAP